MPGRAGPETRERGKDNGYEPKPRDGDQRWPGRRRWPRALAPVAAAARGGPWRSYKEIVAQLAQRVLEAQRPLRILQALRWDSTVEEQFLARSKAARLPKVSYDPDLGFDPDAKIRELTDIFQDIRREPGKEDKLGKILPRDLRRVPAGRGDAQGPRHAGLLQVVEAPLRLAEGQVPRRQDDRARHGLRALRAAHRDRRRAPRPQSSRATSPRTVAAQGISVRLGATFENATVRVEVDDSLLADAMTGSDYVEIRSGAALLEERHRHPRGARGLGPRRHEPQREGPAGGPVARRGTAARHRGAGGPRRAGGDL